MKPRDTARGIVLHDNQILLIERWRDDRHYFSIPGGGIETGETPEQAVLREIKEETSCLISLQRQLYVATIGEATHHIFLCGYLSGQPRLPDHSPEALHATENNRFKPCWVELEELAATPFLIWEPIIKQLQSDLEAEFSDSVVHIAGF